MRILSALMLRGYPNLVRIVVITSGMVMTNMYVMTTPMTTMFHLKGIDGTGWIVAVFYIGTIPGAFMAPAHIHRHGGKSVMLASLATMAICSFILPFANIWIALAFRCLHGYAFGLAVTGGVIIIREALRESEAKQNLALATQGTINSILGGVTGPIAFMILNGIASSAGENNTHVYFIWALMGLFPVVIGMLLVWKKQKHITIEKPAVTTSRFRAWLTRTMDLPSYTIALLGIGVQITYSSITMFLPTYTFERGDGNVGAQAMMLTAIIAAITGPLMAQVTNNWGKIELEIVIARSMFVLVIPLIVIGGWGLLIAAFLIPIGIKANQLPTAQLARQSTKNKVAATAATGVSINLGNFIGNSLGGTIGEATDYSTAMWWTMMPCAVFSTVVAVVYWKTLAIKIALTKVILILSLWLGSPRLFSHQINEYW
ncbi:MFS transporter [Seinonella peptonophila]|uniref:MFS transporter n=1 Tax=Seinonella peptonophila TaxID=112248 RepID=UPI001587895F|nr:MFS transporter [Seinonella peptonophila]